jgi:methyltransferase (TIGR00027 family)
MKLPNLSYMMSVGELRYIQSHFESGAYRNPDALGGAFLTPAKRLRCLIRGTVFRSRVRANPFYAYVVARTKYYDEVFLGAVTRSASCLFNIGSGGDTRAYRFAEAVQAKGVKVFECDQPAAISAKQQIAGRAWPTSHVQYLPIDLNDGEWAPFVAHLPASDAAPALVMMEGVSPYVNTSAFEAFLRMLSRRLPAGSALAYDFKLSGVADEFGRSAQSQKLFRLPSDEDEVRRYHQALGYQVEQVELSSALSRRLVPQATAVFQEDCLVKLITRPQAPT